MNKILNGTWYFVKVAVAVQIAVLVSAPMLNGIAENVHKMKFRRDCKELLEEGEWGHFTTSDGKTILASFQKRNGKIYRLVKPGSEQ